MTEVRERRVLVVEDDETLREVIAEALRDEGHAVEATDNGVAALEVARNWPPDVVVVDLMMPRMNGEEFSAAIRQLNGMDALPIIVVSASRAVEDTGSRIGVTTALRKPFDLYELTDRVNELLR